ncbi:hypothetical protein HPB48_005714 [Haemaphysalis longicornis]|uniref:Uncharacterized protein n=1 Tax=Haemaphysalis longicornis TaxID=44386 RepID=A0A9J6F6U0_HAELO|nr:hypothetical protein HPB48_005714 [Haemaphysalis longicornis]
MAAKCNYGTFLDDALRDRFVAGLRNSTIQTSLLKRKELTFESACVFAKSVELAERESRGFRPTASTDADVHALKKTGKKPEFASEPRNSSKQSCYRCDEENDARSGVIGNSNAIFASAWDIWRARADASNRRLAPSIT